ncbi:MAG: hypothetical protein P8M05_09525 [Flavobacteriales bacterium]|nr:hypothetical protein [Flavobacteriales bacterium]
MRKDDGLYLLVKSLNKNEKRYINIQLSENLRSGESTLLVLFKFIEVLIKKKEHITHDVFIQKSGIKHIYSTKRLLKEAILRGLRNYHENLNFRWKIETLRKNSELFLSKRLPKQALKEIDKAIDLAHQHEAHILICELETLRLECHKEIFDSKTLLSKIESTYNEIDVSLYYSKEFFKHKLSYERVRAKFKINGVARNKNEQEKYKKEYQENHPKLNTTNMQSHCFINSAFKGMHSFVIGEFEASYQASKEMYDILNNNPHEKEDSPKQYLTTIYRMIVNSYFTQRTHEIPIYLDSFRSAETKLFSDYLFKIERYYNIAFNFRLNENDLESLDKLTTEFELIFDRLESHMDREFKLILIGQCANIFLFTKHIKKAKKWNRMLLFSTKEKIRGDIMATSFMRDLIITFEEKKIDLLLSKLKNIRARLSSKKKLYSAELAIIKAFQEIIDQNLFDDNAEVLDKIERVFEDPNNSRILDQFNYVRYFQSKL